MKIIIADEKTEMFKMMMADVVISIANGVPVVIKYRFDTIRSNTFSEIMEGLIFIFDELPYCDGV
jgi:hypothetical protein